MRSFLLAGMVPRCHLTVRALTTRTTGRAARPPTSRTERYVTHRTAFLLALRLGIKGSVHGTTRRLLGCFWRPEDLVARPSQLLCRARCRGPGCRGTLRQTALAAGRPFLVECACERHG